MSSQLPVNPYCQVGQQRNWNFCQGYQTPSGATQLPTPQGMTPQNIWRQPNVAYPYYAPAPQYYSSVPVPVQYPSAGSIAPPVQPQHVQQPSVYGYGMYYAPPYAYAPRMAPSNLPAPQIEPHEDYDEARMTEFLSTMAYNIMSGQTNMWTDGQVEAFTRFVQGVLRSTRLSKHTIILSLCFLNQRWNMGNFPDPQDCDYDMHYLLFVCSLVLANKVHDDNTFTNASWCQATGIPAAQITRAEGKWLNLLNWDISFNDSASWHAWHDRWLTFSSYQQRMPPTPPGLWIQSQPFDVSVAAF